LLEACLVGNTTIHPLLPCLDPAPIAFTPFTPAFLEPLYLEAGAVGLEIHPHGRVQTLPLLGAYVGADIIGGIVATGLAREDKLRVFVDVGTNGEIVLGSSTRVLATAAPAGPAFKGTPIHRVRRPTEGA